MKGKHNAKKTRVTKTKIVKTEMTESSAVVQGTAKPESKSSAVKDELVTAVSEALKEEEAPVLQLQPAKDPVTPAARKWLLDPGSIPGPSDGKRYSPIQFVGWSVIRDFANILDRPLELNEVQVLVQPDGDVETCAVDDIPFQPVRYVPYVAKSAEGALKSGTGMTEAPHRYGGAFYALNGQMIAISGSVYDCQGLNKVFGSPLVLASKQAAKVAGKRGEIWGVERSRAEDYLRHRQQKREESNRRHRRVEQLFSSQGPRRSKPFAIPDEQKRNLDQLKLILAPGSNGN